MNGTDIMAQDEEFKKYRHCHSFTGSESAAEREEWLQKVERKCRAAGIEFRAWSAVDEQGNPGYEFGFANAGKYAAFVFDVFGDLEKPAGHVHTYEFGTEDQSYREAFLLAAKSHLTALGIHHQSQEQPGTMQFVFDRFSDRVLLQALIDQGTIDASAKGLASVRDLQQRVRNPHGELNFPSFDVT
nr:hypothetical protein [Nitrosomonas nitrosa]